MRNAIIFLLTILLIGCYARVPDVIGKEGQPIPGFKFLLRDGQSLVWTDTIKGNSPTVFLYFGTQCPYSRAEIQDIFDNMDEMQDIKFYFVTPDSLSYMQKVVDAYHLFGFSNLQVGQDCEYFISNHFDVHSVPTTLIYGKDHLLKAAFVGQINSGDITKYARE
ncbi:TlpA family protein disulfide reductase [Chitinophaga sp. LS1]|uniref:TlpA family protein disulfide reductase n=1 Tax=Chitinophaga sp. LS1 TaxID=3051176 RepID=UPI002AAAAF36|nr:redoxin domain-containing protein [Chitinophaga sp. LS1]WPV67804.1 redoxin domain-containing protein [Chitinophaga sp. LS1]